MKSISVVIVSLILAFAGGYVVALLGQPKIPNVTKPEIAPEASVIRTLIEKPKINIEATLQLENALSIAQRKISDLKDINQSLSRQIEKMNLTKYSQTTYSELLAKIDRLPSPLIHKWLARLFDEEYLSTVENLHGFSREIAEIALTNDKDEQSIGAVSIRFSHSPINEIRLLNDTIEIDQFDTLYAHILPTQDMDNCIIKWQHSNTGEILLFKHLALNTKNQAQYVWIKPSNGWRTGNYLVTIHDMDNSKQLVGLNTLHISSVREYESDNNEITPDLDVIQDYIMTGEAVPKSY